MATDYHKKPLVNARMDAGLRAWAVAEAERRGQPFGEFLDDLITAERDRVAERDLVASGLGGQGGTSVPVAARQEQPKTTRKRTDAPAAARESKRGT